MLNDLNNELAKIQKKINDKTISFINLYFEDFEENNPKNYLLCYNKYIDEESEELFTLCFDFSFSGKDCGMELNFRISENDREVILKIQEDLLEDEIEDTLTLISYLKKKTKLKNNKELTELRTLLIKEELLNLKIKNFKQKEKDLFEAEFNYLFGKYFSRPNKKQIKEQIKKLKDFSNEDCLNPSSYIENPNNKLDYLTIHDSRNGKGFVLFPNTVKAFKNTKKVTFYNMRGKAMSSYEVELNLSKQYLYKGKFPKSLEEIDVLGKFIKKNETSLEIDKLEIYNVLKKIESIKNF